MRSWTPQDWGVFFGALSILIGGLATAAVTIINALKGIALKVDEFKQSAAVSADEVAAQARRAATAAQLAGKKLDEIHDLANSSAMGVKAELSQAKQQNAELQKVIVKLTESKKGPEGGR